MDKEVDVVKERIRNAIEEFYKNRYHYGEPYDIGFPGVQIDLAIRIVNSIITEGSVVLTKEEYERLSSYISEERAREIFHEETEKLKDAIRKKTEREILQKLKGFRFVMYDEFDDGHEVASWTCEEDDVKRFAKEIGAE